jgi:Mrp family chromosome partitioning ATPase
LTSKAFEDLVLHLRGEFQHLIIDTPPIIGFADGRALSTLADGVLLVFKHHTTSREAGRLAMQLLQQVNARILGGVLNMSRKDRLGYGGYYGYYKYYDQYYKRYQDQEKRES